MKNSNRLIVLGIVLVSLFACCVWLAVLGRTGQSQQAPVRAEVATPTKTYRDEIAEKMDLLASAFKVLETSLRNPRVGDNDWTIRVAAAIAVIRQVHSDVLKMTPPKEMINTHSFIMSAMGDCQRMTDFLADGIDNDNVESINKANDLLISCNSKLSGAVKSAR